MYFTMYIQKWDLNKLSYRIVSWFDLLYNWPPNSELLLNNSLLELIYFLIKIAYLHVIQ